MEETLESGFPCRFVKRLTKLNDYGFTCVDTEKNTYKNDSKINKLEEELHSTLQGIREEDQ